jgi:hypothetical protein
MSTLSPSKKDANVFSVTSPSVSPGRPQRLIQEGVIKADDPFYTAAMEKVYEASWKFDRGKNEDLLKVSYLFHSCLLFPLTFVFGVFVVRLSSHWIIVNYYLNNFVKC